MAGTSGRNLYFQLDNAGGTLQDLSALVNDVDQSEDNGLEDSTTFGASVKSKSYTFTLQEGKISIKGPWSSTLSSHLSGLRGIAATSSFVIGPTGSTAGMEKLTGECRVKSCKRAGKVNGLVELQAELQCDGDVTYTTF
jgi:hypothetical protein